MEVRFHQQGPTFYIDTEKTESFTANGKFSVYSVLLSCYNTPMTIIELLELGNERLKNHRDQDPASGEDLTSPMLDAEILLAASIRQPKQYLFAHLRDEVEEKSIERYKKMIDRRRAHEPVAYIIGKQEFYGREFNVNRFALIPRPDTETLIEAALAACKKENGNVWFADIGTGSGAIAVTLAAETKKPVIATDTSREAVTLTKQNAALHGVDDLIDARFGNLTEPLENIFNSKSVRLAMPDTLIICANLPYLTTKQWRNAPREVKDWEPREALEAGEDGLDVYFLFLKGIKTARATLPKKISIFIETDPDQTKLMKQLIEKNMKVTDLPEAWNVAMKQYLAISTKDDYKNDD